MRAFSMALVCIATAVHAQSWVQLPDFPGEPRDDAAAFAIGGRIFVGTGYQVGWALANDWYVFDAGTWQWDTMAALPASPRQYCATFTIDDIGYLFGGLDAGGALDELWAYDPATNTWSQRASLPAEARYACAAFSIGTLGYVCTGMLGSAAPTGETWSYDPSLDQWSQLADLPGAARHRAAACAGGQWAHVMGGADAADNGLMDVWSFDSGTGQWSALFDPLPEPRYGADAAMMQGGTIFLMGGAEDNITFHPDGLLGSSSSLTWSPSTLFPPGTRRGAVLARTPGDPTTAYFGTGMDSTLTRHNDWWMATSSIGMSEFAVSPVLLFPNPGTDRFRIGDGDQAFRSIEIRDAGGRIVQQMSMPAGAEIDASHLEAGVYLITLTDVHGRASFACWAKVRE